MNTPHILIVDDDMALLQALPHMVSLRIHGVRVDTSDSAQVALGQIQVHDYDVIVSDIKMPGMDGLALLAKIQELRPDIPTILITGHGEQALVIQALRGGAYDFIQKPIDRVSFVAALHRAIQTHQLRRQVKEQQLALELHAQALERLVEERTRELLAANEAKDKLLNNISQELTGFVLHRTHCDLVELCQQVLDEYTTGASHALTFEYSEKPVEVEVDRNHINQVLVNLLSNARIYSPKGLPITVTLQRSGDEAIVMVRDMGIGIAAEQLPHIFKPFYRVPDGEVQAGSHTGLGLGLYISQNIVERHGGRIEVQSSPGSGSTFSVVLPCLVDPSTENVEAIPLTVHEPAPFQPPPWLVS